MSGYNHIIDPYFMGLKKLELIYKFLIKRTKENQLSL